MTETAAPPPARRFVLAGALAVALSVLTGGLSPTAGAQPNAPSPLIRVVVTSAAGWSDAAAAVIAAGGNVLDQLPLVGGVSADLPRDAVLAPSYIVAPDRPMTPVQTDAPAGAVSTVRDTLGQGPAGSEPDGNGVTVAVVDTGVADVPDLAGRLSHLDVRGESRGDGYGHGTLIAGLIAGDGSLSGGAYAGVAPGAQVLDVRVAGDDGSSSLIRVLRGLQAVADRPDVDVVNLSLTSGSPLPYQLDPLTRALESLWQQGVVVVVPAGNGGAIGSPGLDPMLLTVGGLVEAGTADRTDDAVATWSSHGPAARGVAKPDLVAPGASLIGTAAPGSAAAAGQWRTDVPPGYAAGSGTSFATAVTSGAAAVLLGERDLAPDQVKQLVTGTAYRSAALGDRDAAGSGGLDLGAALAARAPAGTGPAAADGPPGQRKQLAARAARPDWAASNWAASNWAASNWAASNWAASNWAASNWAASNWAASNWG